ncbi:phospholipid carrier-dependent glycosyltransferase [Microbacterium sp. 1P10UB]|uniref:dolichyl-phosphate-mannose--protein mannosyltransferase n=1 Tax=unclassified Microbacterium TaxID=2609290 RepID=UPI00399F84D7
MTSTEEPLLGGPPAEAARPPLYERLIGRLYADAGRRRLVDWLAPVLITLIAGILRFANLGQPHALVFDETYYVKDSWSQWNLGYPATWPDDADASFIAGDTDVFTTTGSFVVHPPLGRMLIGLGIFLTGADSSSGWRLATAVFGTALVLLVYLVAKSLTASTVFASVAGGLMAVDGLAIVMSRVALLDVFVAFFVLLGIWFVILDRKAHSARFRAAADGESTWGRISWNRPWLIAAGAALGAASAVKWSGLYVIAAVGLYVVVSDALLRRRAGVRMWPTDAAFRQGAVSFLLLIPIAVVVYLASWTGWLTTTGGWARDAADAHPATGIFGWVPLALQSLWDYHRQIYSFHVGLTSPHSYASPAWQWPLLVRPTSMYYHQDAFGEAGCGAVNGCVQNIYSMPNPLLWWGGVAAVLWIAYRFVRTRDWRLAIVLVGVGATYLPWLLYPQRTIFEFYTIAILPFMVLAVTFALRDVAGLARTAAVPAASAATDVSDAQIASIAAVERRRTGQRIVVIFLALVLATAIFWYPVLTAIPVPYDFWRAHNWLPSWI